MYEYFFQENENLQFYKKLTLETNLLKKWFEDGYFIEDNKQIGTEIELFLLNDKLNPVAENLSFISRVNQKFLVPEVGASHLEINTPHFSLSKNCFSLLHQYILKSFNYCLNHAKNTNNYLAMIGSLPTATNKHHRISFLTKKERYKFLDTLMKAYNSGCRDIHIEGIEPLNFINKSLATNGLLSSFQLHLQVNLSQSVRYYNIAQLIAAPILALSTNSPYFFNHSLCHESRIFIFNEVMTLSKNYEQFNCCLFGGDYLKSSFFDLFEENVYFPYLVPQVSDSPISDMVHLRRQNGVVYRWNRPVIDFNKNGIPHLRIEHRGLSSGPTVADMVANAVMYYGLMQYYYELDKKIEDILPFDMVKKNFFNAARYGMNTDLYWDGKKTHARQILKELIGCAKKGLLALCIDSEDIEFYLNIILKRIDKNINGSSWQLQFIEKYGKDFSGLLCGYLENQYNDIPIYKWSI